MLVELGVFAAILRGESFILGELSLDGSINSVGGIISAAIGANQRKCGIICPQNYNAREAAQTGDLEIVGAVIF